MQLSKKNFRKVYRKDCCSKANAKVKVKAYDNARVFANNSAEVDAVGSGAKECQRCARK